MNDDNDNPSERTPPLTKEEYLKAVEKVKGFAFNEAMNRNDVGDGAIWNVILDGLALLQKQTEHNLDAYNVGDDPNNADEQETLSDLRQDFRDLIEDG